MKLSHPIRITPRLLPGLLIGDGWLSIEWSPRHGDDGRARARYFIDLPAGEFSGDDLQSGRGGASLQQMLESLLSFLGAAAESYNYGQRTGHLGENADLFPLPVVQWASDNADEIGMLRFELEESELIED